MLFLGILASAQALRTLAFRIVDNRIVSPVMINGKGPFQCIIDTGVSSIISTATASALGLHVSMNGRTAGVGEKRLPQGRVTIESISIAGVELKNVSTAVISFDDMVPVFGTVRIDAVLGTPLFEHHAVTVDYDRKVLTIANEASAQHLQAGTAIPIDFSGIPVVEAKLDGVPGRFGVDLGARSALLLYTPFIEKNNLRQKYKARYNTITGWGVGGPVRSQLARANTLEIGSLVVRDIVIRLSTQSAGATTGSSFDGLIGPDVLRQFVTTFDYPHNRVLFEKGTDYGIHDCYDRLGAWLAQGDDGFPVLDVIPGSAAELAGLRKDDVVVSVDGMRADHLVLPHLRDSFRTMPVGTKVQLRVKRDKQVLHLVAKPKDVI